jgi:hypothetical protein
MFLLNRSEAIKSLADAFGVFGLAMLGPDTSLKAVQSLPKELDQHT